MADTLHDTLSDAYDKLAAEPAPEPTAAPEPAPEPAQAATEAVPEGGETQAQADQRARDEKGRFAPKTTEKAVASPDAPPGEVAARAATTGVTPSPAPVVAPAEPKFRAPQSWKPLAREKWAALPPEVQEEIARREGEVPKALEEASQAKRFQQAVTETLRPYEMLARAAGQHPVQYAAGLMQTAAALQTGAPQQRAAVVANIIRQFGVDVEQLAAALDGQPMAPQAQQRPPMDIDAVVDQRLEAIQQRAQEYQSTREVEAFAKDHEFANDQKVRDRMAELIMGAAGRRIELSLPDAYDDALWSLKEYREALEQRKAAEAAAKAQASTQRARVAGNGIKTSPSAAPAAQPKGLREVLEAKYDELASR